MLIKLEINFLKKKMLLFFALQETSTTSRTTSTLDILLTDDGTYYDSSTESEYRPERRAEPRVDLDADITSEGDISYDDIDIFGDEGHNIDISGAEFAVVNENDDEEDQEEDLLTWVTNLIFFSHFTT